MARAVTVTAWVSDAAGNETSAQTTLTVEDGLRDRIDARPNDGSGLWPDFSNTGYRNAPGFPGRLTDWKSGMTATGWLPVDLPSGSVAQFKRFAGKTGISYNSRTAKGITFVGCLFEGTMPNDNLMQIYTGGRITFKYCTFRPAGLSMPPGNDGTVTSSRQHPGTPYAKSWQYVSTMVGAAVVEFDSCDVWGNAGLQCAGGNGPDEPSIFKNCYLHDQADTDSSGAPVGKDYHHDGIGPLSEGGGTDIRIENCTIASLGNTNGIALQGASTYKRVVVDGSYLSGFGYTLAIGATMPWQCTDIAVTNNVFSAELPALFGPWYGVARQWNTGGGTNLWKNNRYQVRAGDGWTVLPLTAHGKFWWPSDNSPHDRDFGG